jgi:hypothetical protein
MISIVDEEIMKSEDGQELLVPPTGEDHETYGHMHINSELTKEQAREITTVLSKYLTSYGPFKCINSLFAVVGNNNNTYSPTLSLMNLDLLLYSLACFLDWVS